ncbi:thiolase family protein [Caproiciproducens sp.]
MRDVVIVGGARTAIANYMGSLQDVPANELGTIAFKGAMEKYHISPDIIEEVVGGHCGQASCQGSNTARWVTLKAGCPPEAVSMTVNQQCPSSMRAAEIISQEIMLGKIDVGAAVGYENMSSMPYLLFGARKGYKLFQDVPIKDGLLYGGLLDPFLGYHMGRTAENIAEMYHISREEQDEYAMMSHQRAGEAIKKGLFKDEIIPIEVKIKKKTVVFDTDEHPRPDSEMEVVSKLPPVFQEGGTVTAFNASGMNDAGSAIIMMSAEKAEELGLKPLARVVATASGAVEPRIMGMSVVPAVRRALKFAGLSQDQIDYWELNEAFAAQMLGANRELKIPLDKVNALGSGISLGHPVGATGTRLIVTMLGEMKRRGSRYGCAALCASGGPGAAFIVENLQ